ncbi:hypothetical protein MMC07_002368 [Pseudocyphellaria aurata]|nr:hypothetical protein [Pseudocyphellaria aurata]
MQRESRQRLAMRKHHTLISKYGLQAGTYKALQCNQQQSLTLCHRLHILPNRGHSRTGTRFTRTTLKDLPQQASPKFRVPLRQTTQQTCRTLGIHSQMAEAGVVLIQDARLKQPSPVAAIYASIFVVIPSRFSAVMMIALSLLKEAFQVRRIEIGMKPSTDRVSRASGKAVTEILAVWTT